MAKMTIKANEKANWTKEEKALVKLLSAYNITVGQWNKMSEKKQVELLQKMTSEYAEFQKEQANLLDNVRQRREQELNDLYQRYQQSVADNQQAFQKAQMEKLQGIQEKVMAAVKKVGEEGGYVYLMDTSSGAVPYINEKLSTDVAPEIKKALGI